ncbi:MAG: type IV pilin N-terminal domain-containing protein [Methanolobus sp.]|nr:type IV pilin N-terminal domain-containing protein [Methanolobus sp.]
MADRRTRFLENTDAVSEVIGEVLLTAVAVLAFSMVAVFIFSQVAPNEKVHADIQGWVGVDSDTIYLRHAGGEPIDIPQLRLIIGINGTGRELTPSELEQIKGNTQWVLGETIRINASQLWTYDIGQDDNIAVTLIGTDSNLVIKSGTLLGSSQDVTTSPGGSTPTAPVLSNRNPSSPHESNTSQQVTFSASSSQASVNEFLLNGQHLAWSNGTSPSYTNTSASVGTYNLTLVARNTADPLLTDSMEWTWTVIMETPLRVPGVDMRLQKSYKGGYIADGDYISFRTGGGFNYISVGGNGRFIGNNHDVMLVMNGQQTAGESDIGISGSSRQITKYDFNVDFYMDGNLEDTGNINLIFINKADNLQSTLSYQLPSHLSQTYFSENGDGDIIIGWSDNASEIRLYNITPTDSSSFRLDFEPGRTYMDGFDALYEIV